MVFGISFAVYTLAIVALGVYSSRFSRRSDEDYFLSEHLNPAAGVVHRDGLLKSAAELFMSVFAIANLSHTEESSYQTPVRR